MEEDLHFCRGALSRTMWTLASKLHILSQTFSAHDLPVDLARKCPALPGCQEDLMRTLEKWTSVGRLGLATGAVERLRP